MNKLLAKYDKKPSYPVGEVNGCLSGKIQDTDDDFSDSDSDEQYYDEGDIVYEQDFVRDEMKRYAVTSAYCRNFPDDVSSYAGFSEVEVPEHMSRSNPAEIFSTYNFNLYTETRKDLPIDSFKEKIVTMVEYVQVVVIEGPTGCGKSTQVPQYILDSYRDKKQMVNIVVTQPRKIATITVAKRVCEERGWSLGTVCGYQIALEKKICPDILLTYMTTGVLLQKLIRRRNLHEYTHIIIDEVHERTQELDFLLLLVRKFLFTNSPNTKVILMSATINAKELAHYFSYPSETESVPAPVISVNTENKFSTVILYLDTLTQFVSEINLKEYFDIGKPEITDSIWNTFLFLVRIFDKWDNDADALRDTPGGVLVFLPGIFEIEEANKRLDKFALQRPDTQIQWEIIPLHSSLPNDEQAKAFKLPKKGVRKIILSTNIAESSITVPDIVYVIDFCLTKNLTVDPVTKYSSLKLEWASHVNCDQRAGRVGRTSNGRVYRLVSREFYELDLMKHSVPEILRSPLDRTVLQTKMLNLNETPAQILALALKPPNLHNIENTVWHLKETGGLLKTCRGVTSNRDGDITFLGEVMGSLPLDVCLSKFIVLGQLFDCVTEAIIIAAGCSIQNIFSVPYQRRLDAYGKMLDWSDNSSSDLISLLNLYRVWSRKRRSGEFTNMQAEKQWCSMHLVSLKGLKEWQLLIDEITARLERMHIKATSGSNRPVTDRKIEGLLLKVITAGAFYPNYFLKFPESGQCSEKEAVKIVGGRDPFSTVYLTGMPPNQPVQVYVRALKKLMQDKEAEQDIKIGFDGSSKIYVEFKSRVGDPVPVTVGGQQMLTPFYGKIPIAVYQAIRKRQLNYPFFLTIMPADEAWKFASEHGIKRPCLFDSARTATEVNCFTERKYDPLPSLDIEYISITISSHEDAGHFWAQNCNEETDDLLPKIEKALNSRMLHPVPQDEEVKLGKTYAAKWHNDGRYYRCRVIHSNGKILQIRFIDYGNTQSARPNDLSLLPQVQCCHEAPLAFECQLANVGPAIRDCGTWSDRACNWFREYTEGVVLHGRVFSVVQDVVHLDLFRSQNTEMSLNEELIKRGFGQKIEESYVSKEDHLKRLKVQQAENPNAMATESIDRIQSYSDFTAPSIRNGQEVLLKGPFSPIEMKLFGVVDSSMMKSVMIDGTSVNAVLLDPEPDAPHASLVVAVTVAQSATTNVVRLRQTTALPNIPGMPALLTMIFCPTMEPKLSEDGTKVVSVLCGLGYNKYTKRPFYPAHDISMQLDTELTIKEIEMINKFRFLLNNGVNIMNEIWQERSSANELISTQRQIRELLVDLIGLKRNSINRSSVKFGKTWCKLSSNEVMMLKPSMEDGPDDIWKLHWFARLRKLPRPEIAENLRMMEDLVFEVVPFEPIKCLLCDAVFDFTVSELRKHLISPEHKARKASYERECQE